MAKLAGIDLEQLGITICSVGGTNFEPYARLLSPDGLNVPFAIITDGDPDEAGESVGVRRIRNLLSAITDEEDLEDQGDDEIVELGESHGFFVGDSTFEIDLFKNGRHESMCRTLAELTTSGAGKKRAEGWKANPNTLEDARFLSDIEAIGKGRFAQRLATRVSHDKCPRYIRNAIAHVKEALEQ
jgi:putative ATP-dependent endonuclease of OLD family